MKKQGAWSATGEAMSAEVSTPIYLDYHATTPVDPRVVDAMAPYFSRFFGNANSVDHAAGDRANRAVSTARDHVADLIEVSPERVFFTSGATEAANLAIAGFVKQRKLDGLERPVRIGLSSVEHEAVLAVCEALEEEGLASLTYLPVDGLGRLKMEDVSAACTRGLDMLCVMSANNEIGTVYPVEALAAMAHQAGAVLFTDATQAAGKIPLRMTTWGIDMLALSGHKLYGPKGIGTLAIREGLRIRPIMFGGGSHGTLRPGTPNVPGIVGLGRACELRLQEMAVDEERIARLRDRLEATLRGTFPDLVVNGDPAHRLAGNLHVAFPGTPNQAVLARVRDKLAISTGSACSSGIEAPSHVLRAMNLPDSYLEGALRLSVGKFTREEDISAAAEILGDAVQEVRAVLSS